MTNDGVNKAVIVSKYYSIMPAEAGALLLAFSLQLSAFSRKAYLSFDLLIIAGRRRLIAIQERIACIVVKGLRIVNY